MIASTMVRASAKGLPLRPVGRGSMSAIIDHWASESSWNLDICSVSQDGRYIFVRQSLGPVVAAISTSGYVGLLIGPALLGAIAELTDIATALHILPALLLLSLAGTRRRAMPDTEA